MDSYSIYVGLNLAGIILGLGVVPLIMVLGTLSLRSHYWFNILNGADKITIKFLWVGSLFLLAAALIALRSENQLMAWVRLGLVVATMLNGAYLTFVFAPIIRHFEGDGKTTFSTLPLPHRYLIFIAGGVSAFCWTAHAVIIWLELVS